MSASSLALLSMVCGLSLRIGSLGPLVCGAAVLALFVAAVVATVAAVAAVEAAEACLPDECWGVGSVT